MAHFTLPRVQTWSRRAAAAYKEQVRQAAALTPEVGRQYSWFVFRIRGAVGESRGRWQRQVPDVEKIRLLHGAENG